MILANWRLIMLYIYAKGFMNGALYDVQNILTRHDSLYFLRYRNLCVGSLDNLTRTTVLGYSRMSSLSIISLRPTGQIKTELT